MSQNGKHHVYQELVITSPREAALEARRLMKMAETNSRDMLPAIEGLLVLGGFGLYEAVRSLAALANLGYGDIIEDVAERLS